nr:hypothetical protein [candidate division Zixibacteria bacterium]
MADLKFSKATDSEHEIKLDSHLISAIWRSGVAYAGQAAGFEVETAFVGNQADIKITGRSEKGKKLGKVSGNIRNNKFIGEMDIPEDTEIGDEIYFEVELSKNGLSGESNHIMVLPPVEITNMKWSDAEARRGEILKLTADVKNVAGGTPATVTIYEFDRDKAHDKITTIPTEIQKEKLEVLWEYEYHEDSDEIPTQAELDKYGGTYNPPEYFFTITIGDTEYGKKQESGLLEFKDWIELQLIDDEGYPIPDKEYELTLPDGTTREGKLDEEGRVRIEDIPPGNFTIKYKGVGVELEEIELEEEEEVQADSDTGDDTQDESGEPTETDIPSTDISDDEIPADDIDDIEQEEVDDDHDYQA